MDPWQLALRAILSSARTDEPFVDKDNFPNANCVCDILKGVQFRIISVNEMLLFSPCEILAH